jgi:outer membrane protein, multidrug efflux system
VIEYAPSSADKYEEKRAEHPNRKPNMFERWFEKHNSQPTNGK